MPSSPTNTDTTTTHRSSSPPTSTSPPPLESNPDMDYLAVPQVAIYSIYLVIFLDYISLYIFSLALPFYASQPPFNATPAQQGILIMLRCLSSAIFPPLMGWLSDLYGRRTILRISVLGAASGAFLQGLAWNLYILGFSLFWAGIWICVTETCQVYITDVSLSENTKRKLLGNLSSLPSLAFLIGPAIGSVLSDLVPSLGLKFPVFVTGFIGLCSFVFVSIFLPESPVWLEAMERKRKKEREKEQQSVVLLRQSSTQQSRATAQSLDLKDVTVASDSESQSAVAVAVQNSGSSSAVTAPQNRPSRRRTQSQRQSQSLRQSQSDPSYSTSSFFSFPVPVYLFFIENFLRNFYGSGGQTIYFLFLYRQFGFGPQQLGYIGTVMGLVLVIANQLLLPRYQARFGYLKSVLIGVFLTSISISLFDLCSQLAVDSRLFPDASLQHPVTVLWVLSIACFTMGNFGNMLRVVNLPILLSHETTIYNRGFTFGWFCRFGNIGRVIGAMFVPWLHSLGGYRLAFLLGMGGVPSISIPIIFYGIYKGWLKMGSEIESVRSPTVRQSQQAQRITSQTSTSSSSQSRSQQSYQSSESQVYSQDGQLQNEVHQESDQLALRTTTHENDDPSSSSNTNPTTQAVATVARSFWSRPLSIWLKSALTCVRPDLERVSIRSRASRGSRASQRASDMINEETEDSELLVEQPRASAATAVMMNFGDMDCSTVYLKNSVGYGKVIYHGSLGTEADSLTLIEDSSDNLNSHNTNTIESQNCNTRIVTINSKPEIQNLRTTESGNESQDSLGSIIDYSDTDDDSIMLLDDYISEVRNDIRRSMSMSISNSVIRNSNSMNDGNHNSLLQNTGSGQPLLG